MLKKNVAIIIDGENTYKNGLLTSLIKHIEENNENIVLKRIYGDFSTAALKGWQQDIALHNLDVKHNYALIKGKNSSDIFIALDLQERILKEQGIKNEFDLLKQIQEYNLTENVELRAITTILKSQKEKEISQHIDKVYLLSCDSDFNGLGTTLKNNHIEVVCVAKSTDFNFNYLFHFDKFFCYMPKSLSENDKKELSLISHNLKAFTKFVEIELNKNFEKKHLESLKDFVKKLTSKPLMPLTSSTSLMPSTPLEMKNGDESESLVNILNEEKYEECKNLEKENNKIINNCNTSANEVSVKFPEIKINFFKHILYSLSKGMANEQKNKFVSLKKNVLGIAETNLSRFYGEIKSAYYSDGIGVSLAQNFPKHFENIFKAYGYKNKIGKATSFKNIHSKIELLVINNKDKKTELNLPLLKELIESGALNFQYILEKNGKVKILKDLSYLYHYLKTHGINLFNGMDFNVIKNKDVLKNIQVFLMDDELKQVNDNLLKITTEETLRKQEKLKEIEQQEQETNQVNKAVQAVKVVEVVNNLENLVIAQSDLVEKTENIIKETDEESLGQKNLSNVLNALNEDNEIKDFKDFNAYENIETKTETEIEMESVKTVKALKALNKKELLTTEIDVKNGNIVNVESEIKDGINENSVEKPEKSEIVESIKNIKNIKTVKENNALEGEKIKIENFKNTEDLNSGSDLSFNLKEVIRKEFEKLQLQLAIFLESENFSKIKRAEREKIIINTSNVIFNNIKYKTASKVEKVKIKKDLIKRFAELFKLSERTVERHYYGYENKLINH